MSQVISAATPTNRVETSPAPSLVPRGWVPLENRYYRSTTIYSSLSWSLHPRHLSQGLVAVAPCAGPVAIIPNHGWGSASTSFAATPSSADSRGLVSNESADSTPALAVYSARGDLIARFAQVRDDPDAVVAGISVRAIALGWTRGDVLVIVYEDGNLVRVRIAANSASEIGTPIPATTTAARPPFDANAHELQSTAPGASKAIKSMDTHRWKKSNNSKQQIGNDSTATEATNRTSSKVRLWDAVVLYEGQTITRTVEGRVCCLGPHSPIPIVLHGKIRPPRAAVANAWEESFAPHFSGSLPNVETASGPSSSPSQLPSPSHTISQTGVLSTGSISSTSMNAENRTGHLVATALNHSSRATDVEAAIVGPDGLLSRLNTSALVGVGTTEYNTSLALSFDGKYVASVSEQGTVIVRNLSTLAEIVRITIPEHLVPPNCRKSNPDALAWVGPDAVAALYGSALMLLGPRGQAAVMPLTTKAFDGIQLQTERDGLRVCSSDRLEFVQLVPECVEAVFVRKDSAPYQLYRIAAAAQHNDLKHGAWSERAGEEAVANSSISKHCRHNGTASRQAMTPLQRYDALKDLREARRLGAAAQSCTDAAELVWDVDDQKSLLQAASYGQRLLAMLESEASDRRALGESTSSSAAAKLLDTAARSVKAPSRRSSISGRQVDTGITMAIPLLRVLNAARQLENGVPISKKQLDLLGFQGLVARFSSYGNHWMALRLSSFCGLPPNDALTQWAKECVLGEGTDDKVSEIVLRHFDRTRAIYERSGHTSLLQQLPYIKAAEAAFAAGRSTTAESLLKKELYPARKVALYLDMGKESLALLAAVASNDNEVVMDAVEILMSRKSIKELARVFKSLPASMSHRITDLVVSHLKQIEEFDNARVLLNEVGRYRESALELVREADLVSDPKMRVVALEKAAQAIGRSAHRRSNVFELYAAHHAISGAYDALDLEKRKGLKPGTLRGASSTVLLSEAARIVDQGRRRDALMRLRKDLKIPERRFYWVVLEALAGEQDKTSVDALSNAAGHGRPPPIGYMAFVDVWLRHGQENEAMKYALRIADLRDRARALARCGRGKEAAEIATKLRNQQLLEEVEALVARHMAQIAL